MLTLTLLSPARLASALALCVLAACGGGGRDGTPIAIGSGSTDTGISSSGSSSSSSASSSISGSSGTAAGTTVTAADELLILRIPYELSTRLHLVPALPTLTGDSAPLKLRTVAEFCAAGGSYASTLNGATLSPGGSYASNTGAFETTYTGCATGAQRIDGKVLDVALESQGLLLSDLTLSNYQTVFEGVTHTLDGGFVFTRDLTVSGLSLGITPDEGATIRGTPFGSGVSFVSGDLLEGDQGIEFVQFRYRHAGLDYIAAGTWSRSGLTQPLTGLVSVTEAAGGTVRGYLRMQNGVLNVEAP